MKMESIMENSEMLSFCDIENIENNDIASLREEELHFPSQDEKKERSVKNGCVALEIKVNEPLHRTSHTIIKPHNTVPVLHCEQSNFKSAPKVSEDVQVSRQTSTSGTDDLTENLLNPRKGDDVVCEHYSHDKTVNLKGEKIQPRVSCKVQKPVKEENADDGKSGSDSDGVIELNLSEKTVNIVCDLPKACVSSKENIKLKKFRSVLSSTREVLTEETGEFQELQDRFIRPSTVEASLQSIEVRRNSGHPNLFYEEKVISQTSKDEPKVRVTQLPHIEFPVEDSQSPRSLNRETANFYQETSYQQEESDYVQIEENSFEAMSSLSSIQTLEDEVSDLPSSTGNPYYANKFQYPLIFSKKYLFGWRRPSDITDLQSQPAWKDDCGAESKAWLTPTRRRHSSNIPDKPKRLLNVRLNHLREMWNSSSLSLVSKDKRKKLEGRGTIVELVANVDTEEDHVAKVAIALDEEKQNEVMLDKLREVVRKCTNTNPALRPSSAEVYRALRKYS